MLACWRITQGGIATLMLGFLTCSCCCLQQAADMQLLAACIDGASALSAGHGYGPVHVHAVIAVVVQGTVLTEAHWVAGPSGVQLLPCNADGLLAAPPQDARAAVQPLRGPGQPRACQARREAAHWTAQGRQPARQAQLCAGILTGAGSRWGEVCRGLCSRV